MITTKKLTDPTLKRITKANNSYEDVHISDISSNVISEGTNITDEVLANINYKDDLTLEFSKLSTNNIPTPSVGKCIIYSTTDGKLFCAINGYNPFEISAVTASDIIKKKGITYVNNGQLEYFNLENGMKLFSNATKIGAIPTRQEETNVISDASYIEFSSTEINTIINNKNKIKIDNDEINLNNDKFILEMANKFSIKNVNNNSLFSINQNGSIEVGNISLEAYIRNIIKEEIYKFNNMVLLDSNVSTRVYNSLNSNLVSYHVFFSDTNNSENTLNMKFNGEDIANLGIIYYPLNNSYYRLYQYIASDDSEDDYVEIQKVSSNGTFISNAYFRGIYKSPKIS